MRLTHGDTGTRLYRIWKTMKCRCLNLAHPSSKRYGQRGITICSKWIESYESFKQWALSNGYEEHLELDRIDVDGDYEPENCRWITHHEQSLNRGDTLYVKLGGSVRKLREVLVEYGIPFSTFNNWRAKGHENASLTRRIGREAVVIGGKKNH